MILKNSIINNKKAMALNRMFFNMIGRSRRFYTSENNDFFISSNKKIEERLDMIEFRLDMIRGSLASFHGRTDIKLSSAEDNSYYSRRDILLGTTTVCLFMIPIYYRIKNEKEQQQSE